MLLEAGDDHERELCPRNPLNFVGQEAVGWGDAVGERPGCEDLLLSCLWKFHQKVLGTLEE